MNAQQRRIAALSIAWQVVDAAASNLYTGDDDWTEDDHRVIRKHLDDIAQSLFNRKEAARERYQSREEKRA